ncbi:MAG: hypothetical protein WDA16_12905 [Candidatus Thermoplasmatota archaeon]
MRAAIVALVLLLVLPPALAQVPDNPVCSAGNFAVTVLVPDAVPAGGKADIKVNVRNNGAVPANVNVSANVATAGWAITGPSSIAKDVNNGADSVFVFSVTPDKTAKDSASVNFAETATCGTSQLPASCPSGAPCTFVLTPSTASVGLQAPSGLRIPGLDNLAFPIEYLIAGVVLVAVAIAIPLALRKRGSPRGASALTCPEPLKPVRAGRGASFPIEIRNPKDTPTKLALEVGAVPEGWSAFLPLPEIQLAPKETRGLWLMVRSPADARSGDAAEVEIKATDPEQPNRPSTVKIRAEVMPAGATETGA